MKRPDSAAVTVVAFFAADAGIALLCGATWAAVELALVAGGMLALLLRESPRDGNDIEALIEATREDMPDYVLDEWVKEYGR